MRPLSRHCATHTLSPARPLSSHAAPVRCRHAYRSRTAADTLPSRQVALDGCCHGDNTRPQDCRRRPQLSRQDLQSDPLTAQVPEPMHRSLPRPARLLPRLNRGPRRCPPRERRRDIDSPSAHSRSHTLTRHLRSPIFAARRSRARRSPLAACHSPLPAARGCQFPPLAVARHT